MCLCIDCGFVNNAPAKKRHFTFWNFIWPHYYICNEENTNKTLGKLCLLYNSLCFIFQLTFFTVKLTLFSVCVCGNCNFKLFHFVFYFLTEREREREQKWEKRHSLHEFKNFDIFNMSTFRNWPLSLQNKSTNSNK